jgi:hypothetical protein
MSNFYNNLIDYSESFFDKFGLMTSDNAILKRAIVGLLIGGFFITYFKPSGMFKQDGTYRPWSLLENSEEATMIPWWTIPLTTGFMTSFLI